MLCLWLHIIICLVQSQIGFPYLVHKNSSHLCHEEERQWLLQLRELVPPLEDLNFDMCYRNHSKPMYWTQSRDCCLWDGVTCDHSTGHVIGLDLSCSSLTGNISSNSSLFRLTHLRNLNLANNYFDSSKLSSEFGQLKSLRHLNLSSSGFGGHLPVEFYHLSNLVSLDITQYDDTMQLHCDIKTLFGNMTKLRVVLLTGVNISSELPLNMSSFLTRLDLSFTGVYGELPGSIFEKPNMQILHLSGNKGLTGSLPSFNRSSVHRIKELVLYMTSISGRLPDSIGFMTNLNLLHLSVCKLSGPIPDSIGNLTQITVISLSGNKLTGHLPSRAGDGLQKLRYMDLSDNSIQGMVPSWLLSLPSLKQLFLSFNSLIGEIGKFNSKSLISLDFSNNLLNIEIESFYNLSRVRHLSLSHNTVTEQRNKAGNVSLPNLDTLELSSCEIKEFPHLLRNLSLGSLDLSNNKIHGPIPTWFGVSFLNLAYNYFTHAPWQQPSNLESLNLRSNSLGETFPAFICNMTGLYDLDLSSNKLRGTIPECIGNMSNLEVLDLRRNELHGKIPTTIGGMLNSSLANLGLNGNQLEGRLPQSLARCSQLEVVDIGNNKINDTFPWWLQHLTWLKVLILKSNSFHGSITPPVSNNSFTNLQIIDLSHNNFTGVFPQKLFASLLSMKKQDEATIGELYMRSKGGYEYSLILSVKGDVVELSRVLSIFTAIDLSCNNFQGPIPESITDLIMLRLLNLSHNNFSGTIPPALGQMTNLEELDLSSNQLSGGIPQALTNLTFLEVFDVSHNHLVGPIPQSNQFPTFSNESYFGNTGLCGAPLTRNCGDAKESEEEDDEDEDEDEGLMTGFTWKTVVIGYACGIVLGFILGNVMMSAQKPKWLVRFVYTEAAIILRRRNKR